MLIAYTFLLVLYLGLTLLYAFAQPKPTPIPPWPLLPTPQALIPSAVHCNVDADCESNHVCLTQTCVPKLLRGGTCDTETGHWISYKMRNTWFAICTCLNPELFTQNIFGGNCNVNVGCGVHGHYDPKLDTCICEPGYKTVQFNDGRQTCQKVPVFEYMTQCDPDEFEVSTSEGLVQKGFHAEYIHRLTSAQSKPVKCVKRPCSFDALSGRPLKHGKFVPDWGCVCDPTYGLFGVVLKGKNKTYLKTEGFDACASIFVKDPQRPIDVKLITYFYLEQREPISLIVFEPTRKKDLIPLLSGKKGPWMIQQPLWRYDYAQYFFKTNHTFRARLRSVSYTEFFYVKHFNEFDYDDQFVLRHCHTVPHMLTQKPMDIQKVYRVLYKNPVCVVDENDFVAHPQYKDRVIVNPLQLTFRDPHYENLPRFNAFVLQYDAEVGFERWTLDLDYPYNVDVYRTINTNVPNYFQP